jgi:hypothetical protein
MQVKIYQQMARLQTTLEPWQPTQQSSQISKLLLLLVIFCSAGIFFLPAGECTHSGKFCVYDGLSNRSGKPDLVKDYGLKPLLSIYENELLGSDLRTNRELNSADKERIQTLAKRLADQKYCPVVCLDIECWKLLGVPDNLFRRNVEKYRAVAHWFHEAAPSVRIGYYGVVPIVDYHLLEHGGIDSPRYADWLRRNKMLAPVLNEVNVTFPCLYTTKASLKDWDQLAVAVLSYAKGLGKPMIAFLWPCYYFGENNCEQEIPGHIWHHELTTAYELGASGAVIWCHSGWHWNDNDVWWQETKKFIGRD